MSDIGRTKRKLVCKLCEDNPEVFNTDTHVLAAHFDEIFEWVEVDE